MAAPAPSWTVAGAIIQAYVKTLDRMGIRTSVRDRVSAKTAAVMDKPPIVVAQVDGAVLDDMATAVAALRGGPDAVREVAAGAMVESLGATLKTLISATLKLFGNSPSTVFERLGTLSAPMIRGLDFKYRPIGETSGVVTIDFPASVSEAYQVAWEGTLEYAYGLCNTAGTVRRQQTGPARRVELRAEWKPAASAAT